MVGSGGLGCAYPDHHGGSPDVYDILPWLKPWHNQLDPDYGMGLGDYLAGFVDGECRFPGVTQTEVEAAASAEASA